MYLRLVSNTICNGGDYDVVEMDEKGEKVIVPSKVKQGVYIEASNVCIVFKVTEYGKNDRTFELCVLEENKHILNSDDISNLCDKFSSGTLNDLKVSAPEFNDLFNPLVTFSENHFEDLSVEEFNLIQNALSKLDEKGEGNVELPPGVESKIKEIAERNKDTVKHNSCYSIDLWSAINKERINRLTNPAAIKELLSKVKK